ncbi:hypothetical protein B0H11DRAFT_1899391 [Mycena galericulata]|nr:hypothetical protein B0H11DRAFT_1899391 [Mycena galericulata]
MAAYCPNSSSDISSYNKKLIAKKPPYVGLRAGLLFATRCRDPVEVQVPVNFTLKPGEANYGDLFITGWVPLPNDPNVVDIDFGSTTVTEFNSRQLKFPFVIVYVPRGFGDPLNPQTGKLMDDLEKVWYDNILVVKLHRDGSAINMARKDTSMVTNMVRTYIASGLLDQ